MVCFAAEPQHPVDEIHLRATVQDVGQLASFSGTVIPVDVDPQFALTVRVESAVPTAADFTSGTVLTFAIHSPSRLFGGEPMKGQTYDFLLHRKTEGGKVRFFNLQLRGRGK